MSDVRRLLVISYYFGPDGSRNTWLGWAGRSPWSPPRHLSGMARRVRYMWSGVRASGRSWTVTDCSAG